jgi:hypothetical protein
MSGHLWDCSRKGRKGKTLATERLSCESIMRTIKGSERKGGRGEGETAFWFGWLAHLSVSNFVTNHKT